MVVENLAHLEKGSRSNLVLNENKANEYLERGFYLTILFICEEKASFNKRWKLNGN